MTTPKNDSDITLGKATKRKLALMLCDAALPGECGTNAGWRLRTQAVWLRAKLNANEDAEASASVSLDELTGADADEYTGDVEDET
jgi:hypothetical protein